MSRKKDSLPGLIGFEEREEKKKTKRRRRAGDIISLILLIVALSVAGGAGYKLYTIFSEYRAGADEYDSINDAVVTERDADEEEIRKLKTVEGEEEKHWNPPIQVDFGQLQEINSDVVGWLYMEALPDVISYPVVKGTDNEFYLHHTYKKEDIFAGSIFVDYRNASDFSDQNTVVYGHNMKDGSMFGTLKSYKDPELIARSPWFWILTPDEAYKYKIYAIYTAAADGETYTVVKGPGKDSKNYMELMYSHTEVDTGSFEFTEKDKTVTLSTCTGDSATRFIVQGVKVEPE